MLRVTLLVVLMAAMIGNLSWSQSQRPVTGSAASASLAGVVSSAAEGPMEGVLVSAKGAGSTVTVTVVSDNRGRYSFPRGRLQPGKYRLATRATGYDLADPGVVELTADKGAEVNLKLEKTKNLASQLMSAEWLMSVPGTDEQKSELYECVGCHSLQLPLSSRHDAKEFLPVLERMRNHAPPSSLRRANVFLPFKVKLRPEDPKLAEYLSTVNLRSASDGKWQYELKALPRPKGKATKVIYTEYDLLRPDSMPHDAVVDKDGMVWYTEFGRSFIGRLNPRTGEVKEWPVPPRKADFPEGMLDLKFDKEGNVWAGMLFQGGVAKFDKKTEKVTTYPVPPEHDGVMTRTGMVSISPTTGIVWFKASQDLKVHGLDPKTEKVVATYKIPPVGFYGMEVNSQGNLYLFGLAGSVLGVMDTATGKVETYPTPTPGGGPRRGDVDSQDRAWFAEFYSGKIGMFDPKTKKIQEWAVPTRWGGSYDLVVGKNGDVWAGGMHTDYIFRLNPTTGQVTEYLLPTLETNIRRVDVDNSTTPPSVWVGENHQGKLAKLEALE